MECLLPALQEMSNNKLITYHLFLHFTPLHSFCPDCLSVETLIVTVAQWQPSHAESWHLDRWGQRKKNFFTCQCSQRQSQQPATGRHLRHEQIVVEWQQSRCSDVNAAYVRKCVWVSGEEIVCGCLLASVVLSLSFSLSSYLSLSPPPPPPPPSLPPLTISSPCRPLIRILCSGSYFSETFLLLLDLKHVVASHDDISAVSPTTLHTSRQVAQCFVLMQLLRLRV